MLMGKGSKGAFRGSGDVLDGGYSVMYVCTRGDTHTHLCVEVHVAV